MQNHKKKGMHNMAKQRRRKYSKIEMIDLSGKRYIEIVEITDVEREELNVEYINEIYEINKKIDKKTQDYMNNLDTVIKYKIKSELQNSSSFNAASLIHEYDYLIKNQKHNEEIISKFNLYYNSLFKKETE